MNTSKLPVRVIFKDKRCKIGKEKASTAKERLLVYHFQTTKKKRVNCFYNIHLSNFKLKLSVKTVHLFILLVVDVLSNQYKLKKIKSLNKTNRIN